MKRIYLDHAATTPTHPEVVEAMRPWLSALGNPSSLHAEGRAAKHAIDEAREVLSETLGCLFAEVLFTSGGTEAANLALIGLALSHRDGSRNRVLMSSIEHHAVLHTREMLSALGFQVELLPVTASGLVDVDFLGSRLGSDVLAVSVMHANNELGTIQPIGEVTSLAHNVGALVHTDAVQSFLNTSPWTVGSLDVDLLTLSGHKINGPKGIGAIYTRAGVKLKPLIAGGGQEREVRGGTENLAGIVGLGVAVKVRREGMAERIASRAIIRDGLRNQLLAAGFVATVPAEVETLTGHLHVRLAGIDAETMLIRLDRMGVSASSGAACSSGSIEPSHVLVACGYSEAESKEGLRFTLGLETAPSEAALAGDRIVETASSILATRVGR